MTGHDRPGTGQQGGHGTEPAPSRGVGRRDFLRGIGALGAVGVTGAAGLAGAAAPALAGTRTVASRASIGRQARATPIQHVIIDCQENRSFDHYYGFAPFAGSSGVPPGYSQPDGTGGVVKPFEFTSLSTPDIGHSWSAVHAEWDAGAMNGFFTTDGLAAMGYYTAAELPFYYSLFDEFTLCGNYFCSLLGPTWPNRFYFAAGTSGGITTNGVWGYGVFDYPIILDLLDAAGVTWKVYNNTWDSVPFGNTDNVFVFWKRYAHDNRTHGTRGDYFSDLKHGRLPQVSWIIPSFARGLDEHPPADVSIGMGIQEDLITALRQSSAWPSSAFLLTYDEHGGYFDHVAPPQLDAYGLGIRVPLWVVSRYAKKGPVRSKLPADHSSTLKLIEAMHGLDPLSSRNHMFDSSTPTGGNYETGGAKAPPRDGSGDISNLLDLFSF